MSKHALSLLKELGLLRKNLPADLDAISGDVLANKLRTYFDERTKNAEADAHKVDREQDLSCLISSFSARNSQQIILPSSLIHNHLVVDDPLYKLGSPGWELCGSDPRN